MANMNTDNTTNDCGLSPKESFLRDGFVEIPGAVSKDLCQILTDYCLLKTKTHSNITKFGEIPDVHRTYCDPLMEVMLERLRPQIEQYTGLELWPSMSFYYTYKNKNKLIRHKDRESGEIAVSISVGSSPSNTTWPLYLDINNKPLASQLHRGDMLIFKGKDIDHWREPLEGEWLISMVLFYVIKDGEFDYMKYDQRSGLGKPHVGSFKWIGLSLIGKIKHRYQAIKSYINSNKFSKN